MKPGALWPNVTKRGRTPHWFPPLIHNDVMTIISIVIPVHNAEKFIAETLDSVLAQTYRDWETLIIDDGSTDNTMQRVSPYLADSRFRIHKMQNAGPSAARNFGISLARGEYIMFLDGDDCLHPDILYNLIRLANPDTIAVCDFIYSPHNPFSHSPRLSSNPKFETVTANEAIIRTLYQEKAFHNAPWAKLYPAWIAKEVPFIDGRRYEDLEIFDRYYNVAAKVAVTHTPLYWYRQHPGSYINNYTPSRLDALWAVDSLLFRAVGKHDPEMTKAAISRRFSAYYNIFGLALCAGYDKTAEKCYKVLKQYRLGILRNSRVRLKNRLGALAAYLPYPVISRIAAWVYRPKKV